MSALTGDGGDEGLATASGHLPKTDVDRMKEDIRRLLGEKFASAKTEAIQRRVSPPTPNRNGIVTKGAARSRSAGQMRPVPIKSREPSPYHLPSNLAPNDVKAVLLDKIGEIAFWEQQIRLELEVRLELVEKDITRKKSSLDIEKKRLEEKDKTIRSELSARERRLALNEEHLRERLDSLTQREGDVQLREDQIDQKIKRRVKEKVKEETARLRTKFYELEECRRLLDQREETSKKREQAANRQGREIDDIQNELFVKNKEIEYLKEDNYALRSKLESLSNYDALKYEAAASKSELEKVKKEMRRKLDEFADEKSNHEAEKLAIQKSLRVKHIEEKRRLDDEILQLRQNFQGKMNAWQEKYESLLKDFERREAASSQILAQNQILSKEVNDLQSRIGSLANESLLKSPAKSKSCCSQCDHHLDQESLRKSSQDLVKHAKQCVDELRRESRLIEERNKLNLQLLTATPITATIPISLPSTSSLPSNPVRNGNGLNGNSTAFKSHISSGMSLASELQQSDPHFQPHSGNGPSSKNGHSSNGSNRIIEKPVTAQRLSDESEKNGESDDYTVDW